MIRSTIFLFFVFFSISQDQSEWKKEMDKEGIIIHTRKISESPFREFLAETTMRGTIASFRKVFSDVSSYPEWMPDCKSVKLIEPASENEFKYHMVLQVPFPLSNRDIVQNVTFIEKPGELRVTLKNCEQCLSAGKGPVRIELSFGSWIVRQKNEEEISIRFQYFADPGGDIPAWLVNKFIVKSPYQTLINLRNILNDQ